MPVDAYPLSWPANWPRTDAGFRRTSKFKTSFARSRDQLMKEIALLGGRGQVLSTNIALRNDGLPYANRNSPHDPGVAVYFELKGRPLALACDRYRSVEDNLHAVTLTVAAIRGIERWGSSQMIERAFTGFEALPAPDQPAQQRWFDVLGVRETATLAEIKEKFRELARDQHPDRGGDHDKFVKIQLAYTEGLEART